MLKYWYFFTGFAIVFLVFYLLTAFLSWDLLWLRNNWLHPDNGGPTRLVTLLYIILSGLAGYLNFSAYRDGL